MVQRKWEEHEEDERGRSLEKQLERELERNDWKTKTCHEVQW
jgi:hypothetical protein